MRWRLLTHDALTLSAAELDERWSLDDALEAHDVLDAIDDARARMAAQSREDVHG